MKELREEYEKLSGKKVFNGWSQEQLEEKITFLKTKKLVNRFLTRENAESVERFYAKNYKTKIIPEKGKFALYYL